MEVVNMLLKKVIRFWFFVSFILVFASTHFCVYASNHEQNSILNFNRYYYNQLNTTEKSIYDNLIHSQENFLNKENVHFSIGTYDVKSEVVLEDYIPSIQKVRKAYIYDNPTSDIWFHSYSCFLTAIDGSIYFICQPKSAKESNSSLQANTLREEFVKFESKCSHFVSTLSGTELEKLTQIHNWIIQNAVYDTTLCLPDTTTAYGTIMNGYSVCSGFAYSFKYLCDLANLDVLYVVGDLYDRKTDSYYLHAWNVAYLEGNYFLIDVTLDLSSDDANVSRFLLSPIHDEMHYASTNYFNYTF